MRYTRNYYLQVTDQTLDTNADVSQSWSVPAGSSETVRFTYTVPNNARAVLKNAFFQLNTSGATAYVVYTYIDIKRSATSPVTRLHLQYNTSPTISHSIPYNIILPAGSTIRIVTANGSGVPVFIAVELTIDLFYI